MSEEIPLNNIRNIGIVAHIDAGKTTTTERILYYTGKIYKIGEVDNGTAVMDWMQQEKDRGITITSAVTTCFWKEHQINIIDTPGHVDFTVEVERSLRVLDGIIVIFCGVSGVQPQSETVWRQADRYKIPRIVFINKRDRLGADFTKVCSEIKQKFSHKIIICQIPKGIGDEFDGIIDILRHKLIKWDSTKTGAEYYEVEVPAEYKNDVNYYYEEIINLVSSKDETIISDFIEGREIDLLRIKKAIRRLSLEDNYIPVFCGSALRNTGIQPLLDAIIDYLPSPMDIPEISGVDPRTNKEVIIKTVKEHPFSGLLFKISSDPYIEKLNFIRIYSGSLKSGASVLNSNLMRRENVLKIFRIHSNKREEIPKCVAGDIVGVSGLNSSRTGDTLCDRARPVIFERMRFPEPVVSVAVEPKVHFEHKKMLEVFKKIEDEDPSFKVEVSKDTGQTIISGMGELHLEVIIKRVADEFNLKVNKGNPRVAYKEGIKVGRENLDGYYEYVIGNKKIIGNCRLNIVPIDYKLGNIFVNKIHKSDIPDLIIEAVKEGAFGVLTSGPISGYPMIGIQIELTRIKYDESSSNSVAYKIAASNALQSILPKLEPVLLEPIMKLEVIVPQEFSGEVIGNLNSKNAQVLEIKPLGNARIIDAIVPLKNMFAYSTVLRSLTEGRGTFTMEFFKYDEAK